MTVEATIHNTLGALYDTVVITSILYGVGCIQAWYYWQTHSKSDSWLTRSLVVFVIICDTVQQGLICAAIYEYAVTNHGNPAAMNMMQKSIMIELYFGGALALAVQLFYCYRIYIISERNWFVSGSVAILAVASCALIYVYTFLTINFSSLGALAGQEKLATALNAVNGITDVSITLAMIFFLRHQKSKTEYQGTRDVLNRLIVFTFNTGIPTSLCAICDVITLNLMPNTFIYMCFYLIMDRLYTNSLLVTLNSRSFIKKAGHGALAVTTGSDSYTMSNFHVRSMNRPGEIDPTITIQVDKRTDVYADTVTKSDV